MGKFVLFREAQQSNIVKKAKEVEGKSAEQILEMFQHQNLILFVTTPYFSEPIDKYSNPLHLYPEVIFSSKHKTINENIYEGDLPSSYFCFKELTFPHQISLFIYSKVRDAQIPPFEVIIDLDSVFNGKDIFQLIDHSFTMDHLKPSTKSFSHNDSAESIIKKARTENIVFHFQLADSSYKIIKKRVSVLQEIQETEQNYLNDIKLLIEFWEPTIRQLRLFNESELTQIFKDFPTIHKCHLFFLQVLKEHCCDFSSMVGDIFLEFSDYFKLSLPYISNYHNIIQVINSKPKALTITDPEKGKDITSYLITPVQHIPRYILFLRELLKLTPSCHPDYEELELACSKIQKITVEMDMSTKKAQQMNEIWMIQKSFTKPFSLISPNRCLKYTINITFKSEQCHLYVFNDFVLIASYDKKSQTVLFSSPLLSFHYLPCFSQMGIIVKSRIYYAVFQSEDARQKFVSDLEDLRLSQDKRSSADLSMFLWSNPFVPKFLPKLSFVDGVQVNDSYVFFGDGSLVTINMKIGAVTFTQSPFGSRSGFAVTGNETDRVFVVGGYNRQCDEYCCDVWQFEVFLNKWTNLTRGIYRNSTTPTWQFHPRCEHTAIFDDDKIYVFGGRYRRSFFNDMAIFYVTTKKWNVLNLDVSPQPRALHSAVMIDKKIVVLGGHNQQTVFNDVNVFDTSTLKWNAVLVNCSIIPKRYGHRSIALQNMIVTIGGTADGETVQKPSVIYCADNYSCRSFKCAGNYPFEEFIEGGFALCFDAARLNLYVYDHCSIFLVQLPQEIKHTYVCNAQSELRGRLFHTNVSTAKRLSATIEEGDVFQSIQSRRRMQKFGTCYTPNSRKLNAFPRSRVRMKVDRKAIQIEAAKLEAKREAIAKEAQTADRKKKSNDSDEVEDEAPTVRVTRHKNIDDLIDERIMRANENCGTRANKDESSESLDVSDVKVVWKEEDDKSKAAPGDKKSGSDDEDDDSPPHVVGFSYAKSSRIPIAAASKKRTSAEDAKGYNKGAGSLNRFATASNAADATQQSAQPGISSSNSTPCFQSRTDDEMSVQNTAADSGAASNDGSSSNATGSPSSVSVSETESNMSLLVPTNSSGENVSSSSDVLSGQSSNRPGLGAQTPSILSMPNEDSSEKIPSSSSLERNQS